MNYTKTNLFLILTIVLSLFSCEQPYECILEKTTQIIPQPNQLEALPGCYLINNKTVIINGDDSESNAQYLQDLLTPASLTAK